MTHRSTCGGGFGPAQNESLCSVANVSENSKKILHRYCFVRMPSPHVTLHGDQCESLMNLKKEIHKPNKFSAKKKFITV